MRGVLIATDFILKENGELTPTEINTSAGVGLNQISQLETTSGSFEEKYGDFFDIYAFDSFLKENSITKVKCIDNTTSFLFKWFCEAYGYEFEQILLPAFSITVPVVEDAANELVIRISYDSYAIIDDLYARDMYEFHNLIKDEEFASPVFCTNGESVIDNLTNFFPSRDSFFPNYVVKPRTPGYVLHEYPRLYRLDSQNEVETLKTTLTNNEFIQKYEFHTSSLVDDRVTYMRSMDLVYGTNLDTLQIITYKNVNPVALGNEKLVFPSELNTEKKLDDLFASKFYPSFYVKNAFHYHFDESDKILLPDSLTQIASTINVGQEIQSVKFSDEIRDFIPSPVSDLETFDIAPSRVLSIGRYNIPGVFANMTAYDEEVGELSWYDGLGNSYLLQESGSSMVQYTNNISGHISAGDKVYIYDKNSNIVKPVTITDIWFDIKHIDSFIIALDPYNEFFINLYEGSSVINPYIQKDYYLIQHNACQTAGCAAGTLNQCGTRCIDCGKQSGGCINCAGSAVTSC